MSISHSFLSWLYLTLSYHSCISLFPTMTLSHSFLLWLYLTLSHYDYISLFFTMTLSLSFLPLPLSLSPHLSVCLSSYSFLLFLPHFFGQDKFANFFFICPAQWPILCPWGIKKATRRAVGVLSPQKGQQSPNKKWPDHRECLSNYTIEI